MKHKLINYGKKTKKLWVSAIVVLFVVAVAYSQIVKAQYGTDKCQVVLLIQEMVIGRVFQ